MDLGRLFANLHCTVQKPPNDNSHDSNVILSRAKMSRMRPTSFRSFDFDYYCFDSFLIASRMMAYSCMSVLNVSMIFLTKTGSRDCARSQFTPNVQDAFVSFVTATMPNGIWLKTGHDWLGRTNEVSV